MRRTQPASTQRANGVQVHHGDAQPLPRTTGPGARLTSARLSPNGTSQNSFFRATCCAREGTKRRNKPPRSSARAKGPTNSPPHLYAPRTRRIASLSRAIGAEDKRRRHVDGDRELRDRNAVRLHVEAAPLLPEVGVTEKAAQCACLSAAGASRNLPLRTSISCVPRISRAPRRRQPIGRTNSPKADRQLVYLRCLRARRAR